MSRPRSRDHLMSSGSQSGFWASVGAFLIWGVFPIFWKWLDGVPALQIMTHRIFWCFVFVVGYLVLRHGLRWWQPVASEPRLIRLLSTSSILIALNWWLYIWAVNAGHIVETSLGYFINPLVNVLLGVVVLRERLNRRQWLAVLIATGGVALPRRAIRSATLDRPGSGVFVRGVRPDPQDCRSRVDSRARRRGDSADRAGRSLPALDARRWQGRVRQPRTAHRRSPGQLGSGHRGAAGAFRVPALSASRYSAVGVLQYIAPTLQLACGVLLFKEPFTRAQAFGFGAIWLALTVYAGDALVRRRRGRPLQPV